MHCHHTNYIGVAGEVVGALPVAHEPSSFSFSLLILSFAVVAISFIFLDLALCLLKDRGKQLDLLLEVVLTNTKNF